MKKTFPALFTLMRQRHLPADVIIIGYARESLTDERFQNPLVSKGVIIAESGVSGSLTRLTDGTSYLIAGGGVDILSASNGAITISSSGLNIGNISSSLADSTVAKADFFAIHDADADTTKKITLEDIVESIVGGTTHGNPGLLEEDGRLYLDINGLTAADIDPAADFIAFSDESATSDPTRKESVSDFVTAIDACASISQVFIPGGAHLVALHLLHV